MQKKFYWFRSLRTKLLMALCAILMLGSGLFIRPALAEGVAANPASLAAGSSHPPDDWLKVVSWGYGRLDVFARSKWDGAIWLRTFDYQWYPWVSLGNPVTSGDFIASIEAVSWGVNRLDVFAVSSSRVVWHKAWNGAAWSGWESIGGVDAGGGLSADWSGTGGIQAVSWGAGRIDLFTRGTYSASGNGTTWQHKAYNGAWWPSQTGWETLQTVQPGAGFKAHVVSWGPNRLDIIKTSQVTSQNNNLYWKYWNGSSWGPGFPFPAIGAAMSGQSSSAPWMVSWGANRLDAFMRGTDGAVWHNWYVNGSPWGGWESLGGGGSTAYNTPTANSWGAGRLDIFENRDGWVYHKYFDGTWQPAGTWEFLGGGDGTYISRPPAVASWSAGRLDLFATVPSGHIWHKWFEGSWGPSQVDWEDLGGPPG